MVRRSITIPDSVDARIREAAKEDESFSETVARLIEVGLAKARPQLAYIGSGASGDADLAFRVEEVLAELARATDE